MNKHVKKAMELRNEQSDVCDITVAADNIF